jgi:hypothetical protein
MIAEILWGLAFAVLALAAYVLVRGLKARSRLKKLKGRGKEIDTGM